MKTNRFLTTMDLAFAVALTFSACSSDSSEPSGPKKACIADMGNAHSACLTYGIVLEETACQAWAASMEGTVKVTLAENCPSGSTLQCKSQGDEFFAYYYGSEFTAYTCADLSLEDL